MLSSALLQMHSMQKYYDSWIYVSIMTFALTPDSDRVIRWHKSATLCIIIESAWFSFATHSYLRSRQGLWRIFFFKRSSRIKKFALTQTRPLREITSKSNKYSVFLFGVCSMICSIFPAISNLYMRIINFIFLIDLLMNFHEALSENEKKYSLIDWQLLNC